MLDKLERALVRYALSDQAREYNLIGAARAIIRNGKGRSLEERQRRKALAYVLLARACELEQGIEI